MNVDPIMILMIIIIVWKLVQKLFYVYYISSLTVVISRVKNFLVTMYHFLDKKLDEAKINTICIVAPPNSGKNFLVDLLASFMLNSGKIENPSRGNAFPWMDGFRRRLNKWNEAHLDPFFEENILDLMQGNMVSCNIKYEALQPPLKTPLIVMANNSVFPNQERFNVRHIRYNWKQAPLLFEYRHKGIYPMSIGYLLLWAFCDGDYDYSSIEKIINRLGLSYYVNLFKDLIYSFGTFILIKPAFILFKVNIIHYTIFLFK